LKIKENWFCYLLRCADGTLYCGITNDIERPIAAHNAETAAKFTKALGQLELVFVENYLGALLHSDYSPFKD
jgi:putative endonuclease